MKAAILGPIAVTAVRMIGAWPGSKSLPFRLLIWVFLVFTLITQVSDMVDAEKHHTLGATMESLALAITNMLAIVKFGVLWNQQGSVEECLDMMEEDWKSVRNEKYLMLMSNAAKGARTFLVGVVISYYCTVVGFVGVTLLGYSLETQETYRDRELILKATYPFNVHRTPVYQFLQFVGALQGTLIATGNGVGDGLLFVLSKHVNGQLDILHDRLTEFTDVRGLPEIIRQHQKIIHFAEIIEHSFKWIALAQFVSVSVVICAAGYVIIMTLETDGSTLTIVKLLTYMSVMQLGSFIYCHTGNILTEKTLNIRQAAYESRWSDLPPETSKILIIIMMRADKPLSLTAGGFCNLSYDSFVNMSKTAASYLSVIRASSE